MLAQVKTWGNSQGIRLPKDILEEAKIGLNDFLTIEVIDGNVILKKQFRHKTLEERIAEHGGVLEPYGEYDWGEPVGREVW